MFPSLQHNLKITTQLRMTPQLQQAVKLLQYNRAELVEFINTEMLENPTLEERPVEEPASDPAEGQTFSPSDDNKPIHSATAQSAEQASDAEAVHSTQIDWNRVDLNDTTHRFQAVRPVDDLPGYDQTLSRSETLTEHLSWQLRMLRLDEGVLEAAELVHSLDEKGWFSEGWTAGSSTSLSLNGALKQAGARQQRSSTRLVSARSTSKSACSCSSGP